MLNDIRSLPSYQNLLDDLKTRLALPGLALPRAARLPVIAALLADLDRPILLLTDRADHALTMLDELGFWAPDANRHLFPEPTPLFYERASWGSATRRDRLQVLASMAAYHMPAWPRPAIPPVVVAPVRALMARTLPRRDFLISSKMLKVGQTIAPETLLRTWVDLGYQAADIVLEAGQFSHRGGILDVWAPSEPYPARLDFFGDEIDTIRRFDPASQRTINSMDALLVTPAREVLAGKAEGLNLQMQDIEEFFLPLVHPARSSLLDYLPQNALILIDDLDGLQVSANEIEEQAVRLRKESIAEGSLAADFPIPYISWSELQDSLAGHAWLELGRSTAEEVSRLAECFTPGPRFGGRLETAG